MNHYTPSRLGSSATALIAVCWRREPLTRLRRILGGSQHIVDNPNQKVELLVSKQRNLLEMNAYLKLAKAVLSKSSQPLSAAEIMDAAYRLQLVPDHLYGRTQHKTLQARLSEDILYNRNDTTFARAAPGKFVLREKLDTSKTSGAEYIAPLRSYQLRKFDVLCAYKSEVAAAWRHDNDHVPLASVLRAFNRQLPLSRAERSPDVAHLRILVCIRNDDRVLTVNSHGDPSFGPGRSVGFLGYLKASDIDLFSQQEFGLNEASLRTLREQTGLSGLELGKLTACVALESLTCFSAFDVSPSDVSVVVITAYECKEPDQFMSQVPSHRQPRWACIPKEINDIDALEPLSKKMLISASPFIWQHPC